MMPCLPLFPGDPVLPWSPLFSLGDLFPLRARDPLSTFGLGGPGGPGEQLSSFE